MRLDGTDWLRCAHDADYRSRISFCLHLKEDTAGAVVCDFPPSAEELDARIEGFNATRDA